MTDLAGNMNEQDPVAQAAPALLISLRQMLAWVQARVEPSMSVSGPPGPPGLNASFYSLLRAEIKAAQEAIAAAEGRTP